MRNNKAGEQRKYSSQIIEALLTNDRFNFWSKDWSKRIIVKWDGKSPLKSFRNKIIELVGKDFIYEYALNSIPTQYVVIDGVLHQTTGLTVKN